MATPKTRREIERLLAGESVEKKVNQELTYRELYQSIDNLWSILFTTGYLIGKETVKEDDYALVIPNLEIRKIFVEQVMEWFKEEARKENFYHGILLGLLSYREDWNVDSNIESGDGYSDIQVEIETERIGFVIEVKYADEGDLKAGCREALKQIEEKGYEERLKEDGMSTIFKYGIACRKKECMVRVEKETK